MRKVLFSFMVLLLLAVSVPGGAATIDIAVTAAGDTVYYRNWYYGGSDVWSKVDANPNQVSHSYEPGWGNSAWTVLNFDLNAFTVPVTEIISAALNIDILDIWTSGRDDVGNLNSGGTVLASGGTGWKSFDITDSFKSILAGGGTTAGYSFNFTGYSGFTFGSAEGGQPAYLRITTAGAQPGSPSGGRLAVWRGTAGAVWCTQKNPALDVINHV